MFIPLALVLLVTGLFWLCSAPRSSSPQVPLPVKVRFAVFGQSGIGYPVTRPGIGPVIAKRAIAHHLRPGLPGQLCVPFRLIKSPDKAVIPILFAVP